MEAQELKVDRKEALALYRKYKEHAAYSEPIAVKRQAVRVYCSEIVTQHLESYTLDRMAEDLIQRGKWRVTYRAIGYDDDIADAVSRG